MADTNLTTQLSLLASRIGDVCKTIEAKVDTDVADLASYKTTAATALSDAIAALKQEILGGASSAYDTLKELENILKTGDDSFDAALKALMCVSYEHAQTLTEAQKVIARTNMGAASGADVTTLSGRMDTAESTLTTHGTRLDTAESDIDALEALVGSASDMDFVSTFNAAYTATNPGA